ncbi:MAG: 50S ribosomal protein L21 [Candidatus Spechtbacterales bacterium]
MSDKFVIIKTGGKQYKVSEGSKLKFEKLPEKEGKDIEFKEVLLYADGRGVDVGTPNLSGVSVTGRVVEHGKGDKVIVFKKKKRKRYSKKKGHRQPYTEVEITEIHKGGSQKTENSKPAYAEASAGRQETVKKPETKKVAPKKKATAKK